MGNRLLSRLRENDKRGLFSSSQVSLHYQTGFLPFDYLNGYKVKVIDLEENMVGSYPSIGIRGGTFVTVIGKSGVAKTTWVVQTAYNIVKDFKNDAFVLFYDLEQALNYTRIKNITGASQKELDDKFILRQEKNYIEDIFESIIMIATMKEKNKEDFMYDTGMVDEFNKPIRAYIPTIVAFDSIPTLSSRETDGEEEMKGQTDAMRSAKQLKQFYSRLMPIIKTYNITVIAINHINQKVDINPFAKTQSQVMYLKQDESMPGGNAPIYYADTLIKFVSSTKFKTEDDGFDGFLVKAELIKSRSNKAGQMTSLVYNQLFGFDKVLTLYQYANDKGLIDGRNPYKYFKTYKDVKFDSRKFKQAYETNEQVREALHNTVIPLLEKSLDFVTL